MPALLLNDRPVFAKAILFDKDGTLVEFHELWVSTTENRIKELSIQVEKRGRPPLDQDEQRDLAALLGVPNGHLGIDHGRVDPYGPLIMSGPPDHETLAAGFVYQRRGGSFNEILSFTQEAFKAALALQHPRLLNGAAELLMKLQMNGWLLGIVTNDGEEQTQNVLDQMGVKGFFHSIVCAHEKTVNGATKRIRKPDPEMVTKFCEDVGVSATDIILVADSHNDLKMGSAAHCSAIVGVISGVDTEELLKKASPDCILESVASLLGMILTIRRADMAKEIENINAFYANPELHYSGEATLEDEVFVAEIGGQLVGCVRLCEEEGQRVLRGMCVHPQYQRRGFGTQMLSFLLPTLKDRNCWCIPYTHLVSFYEQAGYREQPLNEKTSDAVPIPEFLLLRWKGYQERGLAVCIMCRASSASD